MRTKRVELGDIAITVSEANVLIGMRRTRLQMEGRAAGETDPDRGLVRLYTYPDLVAATVEVEGMGWPVTFEEFIELPDRLAAQWESAVYELNPHWLPQPAEGDQEKKDGGPPAMTSTGE